MVGVRRRRWLVCGIAVWLVITATIFFTLQSDSVPESEAYLQKAIADDVGKVGGCRPLAMRTVQMISTSETTIFVLPFLDSEEVIRLCTKLTYDPIEDLPRASVIITFHDTETISSLLHTIHSVIQRTPCQLLQEIIVIDDFSKKDDLGDVLEIYLRTVFSKRVKLFRNSENVGLVRSRLKGVQLSQGEVIVFMDSHSEVQPGWLEPLLYEIKKNRTTMAHSFIDWMDKSTGVWHYKRGGSNWVVYFDWRLEFGWQMISKQEGAKRSATDPIKTKIIIGAYAAIDRRFFKEIGEFDDGMQFWGGENIDLSLRVWLFGGQIVSVPCSRVAHLEGGNLRDYRDSFSSLIERNYKRVVEVWFDEYKPYFYQYFPTLIPVDPGNLRERMKVKARAMYNFSWYLQNVFPELGFPDKDSFAWGSIKNLQRMGLLCLDCGGGDVQVLECDSASHAQIFYWSQKFEFRKPIKIFNLLPQTVSGQLRKVLTIVDYIPYYNNDLGAKWIHWKNGPLIEQESGLCLSVASDLNNVEMLPCDYEKNRDQVWEFEHYMDQYFDTISGNRSIETQYKTLLSNLLNLKSASSIPVTTLSEGAQQKSELKAYESLSGVKRYTVNSNSSIIYPTNGV